MCRAPSCVPGAHAARGLCADTRRVRASASLTGTAAFGNQQVGTTSAPHLFTYTNTSATTSIKVSDTGVTLTGSNPTDYAIASNTCIVAGIGATLAPTGTCTIGVTFTPSVSGSRTATLNVIDDPGGAPNQTAGLTGSGVNPSSTLVGTVAYRDQQLLLTSAAHTFTFTNTGIGPFTVSSITLTGTNPTDYAIVSNLCVGTISALGSCTFSVTFTPSALGSRTATVTAAPAGVEGVDGDGGCPITWYP